MTAADLQTRLASAMREAELQQHVADLCRTLGLDYYHTHDSRHSPEGFPDCVIVRGDVLLIRELKRQREQPTPAQLRWLAALGEVRRVSVGVWRPTDWLAGRVLQELCG